MSNLEVKVGQVYMSLVTNGFYIVSGIDSKCIYLSGGGSVVTVPYKNLHKAFQLVKEPHEEDKKEDTTSLRDHFAGLAMQSLIPIYWDISREYDSAEALVKCLTEAAYEHADAMLKAGGD